MTVQTIGIIALALIVFSLFSRRLDGSLLTPPMLFIAFGLMIGVQDSDVFTIVSGHGAIHTIAELTLILVLFSDATRIRVAQLKKNHAMPVRLLVIGLPLVIVAGTLAALWIFPSLELWEAAVLAAVLAPTDAALGQAVVSDPAVPVRIRQTLNVESGLNDGIALPAVLLFAALANMEGGHGGDRDWLVFGILQITLGPVAGVTIGWIGGRLLDIGIAAERVSDASQGIGILAIAILAFAGAELIGGNGFIAVFTAGLAFGAAVRHPCRFLFEFMETEGQLLMLITFLIFGAAMLPEALAHIDGRVIVYVLLSLTVLRMLPTAIALLGSGIRPATYLFVGWFGPRGLASILFALLIVEDAQFPASETILTVTVLTVAASALLHGLSAAPFARRYAALARRVGECAELQPVPELPLRSGMPDDGDAPADGAGR